MERQTRKPDKPPRRTLVILACLLPALCGACSWVQALQAPMFRMSFGDARSLPLALPFTEVQVRMVYPDGTNTVDGAVSYMLEPHAYSPAYRGAPDTIVAQRSFIRNFDNDPVPLSAAIQRLMGQDGQIIMDRDRKLYAFRLKNPDEPGIVFADLGPESFTDAGGPASWEQLNQASRGPDGNAAPGNEAALPVADLPPAEAEDAIHSGEHRDSCRSIQFRNRAMLSVTVRKYFLGCGFDEVSWKLGAPGRYADYQLLQNIDVPLPERHLDLIELLQTRFGIRTLISEDHRVEFRDENNSL